MKFTRYSNTVDFAADTLEIMLENEAQNNLPISFTQNKEADTSKWMLASIKDDNGSVVLTAACTPPFNIVMYETGNKPNEAAVKLLSDELKSMGFTLPGVTAEQGLAQRFAEVFANTNFQRKVSMNIMHLDKVADVPKSSGHCRPLREEDLFFTPYWEWAFGVDCNIEEHPVKQNVERQKGLLGKDVYYIWEDRFPVSQAINWRNLVNGAVVSYVYTPPHYRGKGYASSVVAELSQILLDRGNKFCCLFADAGNPVSNGIYRKIGYRDVCVFDELKFNV